MIERLVALARGLDEDREVGARLGLADEFRQQLRTQRGVADIVGAALGGDDAGGRVHADMLARCSGLVSHQHRVTGSSATAPSTTNNRNDSAASRAPGRMTADDSLVTMKLPSRITTAIPAAAASQAIQTVLRPAQTAAKPKINPAIADGGIAASSDAMASTHNATDTIVLSRSWPANAANSGSSGAPKPAMI